MEILDRHSSLHKKKTSFPRLMGSSFNNHVWRELLNSVCLDLKDDYPEISVISPFGFELLENKFFLQGHLRRFYIYVGIADEDAELANKFSQLFLEKLSEFDPRFFDDVVILIENDKLIKLREDNYNCLPTDKLIDVQIRKTHSDILSDYADYIVASLVSLDKEVGEVAGFRTNKKFRWRLYQLYLMHEKLFGHLVRPLTIDQLHSYKFLSQCISNRVDIFYDGSIDETLSKKEMNLVDSLIKPRINQMLDAISSCKQGRKVTLQCWAYHYHDKLELTLGELHYQDAVSKIKATYLGYV